MTIDKQQIFLQTYEGCKDSFTRYCTALSFGKMNAEDLEQDILLSAYERFDQIKNKDQLLHYLVRAARNKHISQLRRKKFQPELLDQHSHYVYAGDATPEVLLDVQLVFQALNELPEDQADAVLLFEWMGFSVREIAEIQESSEGAVKTRISRGRKRLRKILEKETDRDVLPLVFVFNQPESPGSEGSFGMRIIDLFQKLIHTQSNGLGIKLAVILFFVVLLVSANIVGHTHEKNTLASDTIEPVQLPPEDSPEDNPPPKLVQLTSNDTPGPQTPVSKTIHCTIKGEVIGRDSEFLILAKATEDVEASKIEIPIIDGQFEYQLNCEHAEAYKLVFKEEYYVRHNWLNIFFFPEEGELTFKLYPTNFDPDSDEPDRNQVIGGELNEAYQQIKKSFIEAMNEKSRKLYDEMRLLEKQGKLYNAVGQAEKKTGGAGKTKSCG